MNRAQLEALIADYLDGVLGERDAAEFEKYLPLYPDLAELVADAAEGMRLLGQVDAPEPPPALYTRIQSSLDDARRDAERAKSSTGLFQALAAFFAPVLQPRFVMGMAMTVLSISMIGQLTGTRIDRVTAADLKPTALWSSVEDRVQRVGDRAAKYYEGLRVVCEMRARVQNGARWSRKGSGRPAGLKIRKQRLSPAEQARPVRRSDDRRPEAKGEGE